MYNLSAKFNEFYKTCVVLPALVQNDLRQKKNLNIKRLKDGLEEYNSEHGTNYKISEERVQGSMTMHTVLVDQIYRTHKNLSFCKERGIRMSEPLLGRPRKDMSIRQEEQKIAYKDNTDRIAVERAFALAKHSYGLGLVTARLDETTRNTIAMSVLAMNIDRILAKRMFIFWAKICGLIRTAILETIKGRKDELCMAAAY